MHQLNANWTQTKRMQWTLNERNYTMNRANISSNGRRQQNNSSSNNGWDASSMQQRHINVLTSLHSASNNFLLVHHIDRRQEILPARKRSAALHWCNSCGASSKWNEKNKTKFKLLDVSISDRRICSYFSVWLSFLRVFEENRQFQRQKPHSTYFHKDFNMQMTSFILVSIVCRFKAAIGLSM